MGKPILCLDWDGVIHSYTSGWKGAAIIPDPPVEGAIAFMLLALQHFNVVVHSSRSNQPGGIGAMQSYLYLHGGAAWHETPDGPGLESVQFVTEKPPAMVGIDDRVLTFTGQWPSVEELKAFQPWNKKPALEWRPGRFRKKPVEIAATQWFKNGDHPDDGTEVFDSGEFKGERREGKLVRFFCHPDVPGKQLCKHCVQPMRIHGWIETLEGGHIVCPGDWIITGVKGEMYPCKPDIFAATYDAVSEA